MTDRIHAIGYRPQPEPPRRLSAIWPIARTLVALALRKRATKVVLALCLGVLAGHGVWLAVQLLSLRYAGEMRMHGAFGVTDLVGRVEEVFSSYLQVQFYFTVPAIAVVAGGAIAEDRRAGAFELYFSRPLTRMSYGIGKLLGTAAVPLVTLVAATLLLWLAAVGIAPEHLRADLWHIAPPALAGAFLGTAVLTATLVGVSSLSRRATSVAVAFVALVVVGAGVAEGLAESGQLWGGYLSPERNLRTVVDHLLDLGSPSLTGSLVPSRAMVNVHVVGSFVALLSFIGAGLLAFWIALRREVRS